MSGFDHHLRVENVDLGHFKILPSPHRVTKTGVSIFIGLLEARLEFGGLLPARRHGKGLGHWMEFAPRRPEFNVDRAGITAEPSDLQDAFGADDAGLGTARGRRKLDHPKAESANHPPVLSSDTIDSGLVRRVTAGGLIMQNLIPGLFLLVLLSLFSESLQDYCAQRVRGRKPLIFVMPVLLSAFFCLLMFSYGALSGQLALLIVLYTHVPAALLSIQDAPRPGVSFLDFAAVLALWLPLEFAVGKDLIPVAIQGFIHTVAYGIALVLALWLFLIWRGLDGMKYRLPAGWKDFRDPLAAFALVGPVLIVLGLWLSFLDPFHLPQRFSPTRITMRFLVIAAATALPEEILFRGLIQNWLMQKLGFRNGVLLVASIIFGCAHLNNAPGPFPNWRYMILATIAGFAFGKVFQRASSILASVFLHALVNTTKHFFF